MSIICKTGQCAAVKGMCGHEKLMLLALVVVVVLGAGHYGFGWF